MKKTYPLLLGMLLPILSFAQNPGFENDLTDWSNGGSLWSIATAANQFRSGTKAAKLTTTSTADQTNRPTSGQSVTVPASGTNYVTVIAYVRAGATNAASTAAAVGIYDGTTFTKGSETTAISSGGFVAISQTFAVSNGTSYTPVLYGRSTTGNSVDLFYDDVIIYTSTSAATDLTAPTGATRITVTTAGSTLGLSWTAGTDGQSGIDGTLILRTSGTSAAAVTPTNQTFYSSSAPVGPTAVGTFNVRANAGAAGSYSESVSNNTVYTYVIFMRDKAYNYSPVARIFVFNGTGLSGSTTNNASLHGFYLPAGNTFTTQSSSTITLQAGTVNIGGTIINQGNVNNSAATLTFESGSVYTYNRNNGGGFSIPTATWAPGSLCRVTGVTTAGPSGTGQQFANFEWNSTGQTAAATLAANFGVTGTLTINSTGTGSLRFPATGTHNLRGNVTQNGGTVVFEAGNTVVLNGSSAQTISVNGPLQNVTVNNTAGVNPGRNVTIATGLMLSSGTLSAGAQRLTMGDGATITRSAGQLATAPTFTNNVNVTYTAPVTTGPELPTATSVLQTLTLNTTGAVTLGQAATVNTELDFTLGSLLLGNNDLTIGNSASISDASASQFVVTNGTGRLTQNNLGPAGRTGAVVFPVGSSITSYTPATLTNTGVTDAYSVRVYPEVYDNYDASGNATGSILTEHVVNRTWAITEATAGGSNLTAELAWNAANEIGGFTRGNSFVSYFAGGQWNGANGSAAVGSNPYTQTRSNLGTLGAFGVGDQLSALPVTLLGFTARPRTDGAVQLDWATSAEVNNDYFAVERSTDGARTFQGIARVAGRGTTDGRVDYAYLDATAPATTLYYRLRQVDYDGSFEFSPVVRVVLDKRSAAGLFRILSQTPGQVTLATDNQVPATLRLIGLDGRTLQTLAAPAAGTYTLNLPPAGIYLLEVRTAQDRQVRKVLGR